MSIYDDLKRDLERIKSSAEEFIPDRAKLGWVVDGVYTIVDPVNPRKFWVRFTDQAGGISAAALEHRGNVAPVPDLDVLIAKDRFTKQLYIWGITNEARAVASPNGDDPSIGLHSHDRFSGRSFLIDDRLNFKFRVDPISGLVFQVKGGVYFHNSQFRWMNDSTINLTGNRPTTSGHHAWVVIGINTTTGDLVAVTGASQPTVHTLLKTQIFDVSFNWNDHVPLCAVRLSHGQTASPLEQDYEALLDVSRSGLGNFYQTVQNDSANMPRRGILSFFGSGVTVTDDPANNRTRIQITGGGGGGGGGGPHTLYTRTLLFEQTLAANGAFDIQDISQSYVHLEIIFYARSAVSGIVDNVRIFFNNDTTLTNYRAAHHYGGAAHVGTQFAEPHIGWATAAGSTADLFAYNVIEIPFYTGNKRKDALCRTAMREDPTTSFVLDQAVNWANTSAINRIMLRTDNHPTDLFVSGTVVQLFGIKETTLGGLTDLQAALMIRALG